jgi:hypothetical protein
MNLHHLTSTIVFQGCKDALWAQGDAQKRPARRFCAAAPSLARKEGGKAMLDLEMKAASRGTTPGKPLSAKEGRILVIEQYAGQVAEVNRK